MSAPRTTTPRPAESPDFSDGAQCFVDWMDRYGEELPDSTRRAIEAAFGAKLRAAIAKPEGVQS